MKGPAALGEAGLQGWRTGIARLVAPPVAKRSRFSEDAVQRAIGLLFVVLSVVYLVQTARRVLR